MFTRYFSNFNNYDCQHFIVESTVDILNAFVRGRRQDCACWEVDIYQLDAMLARSSRVRPSSVRLSVKSRSSTKINVKKKLQLIHTANVDGAKTAKIIKGSVKPH